MDTVVKVVSSEEFFTASSLFASGSWYVNFNEYHPLEHPFVYVIQTMGGMGLISLFREFVLPSNKMLAPLSTLLILSGLYHVKRSYYKSKQYRR